MTKGKIVGGISVRAGMKGPSPEEILELTKMKKAGEEFLNERLAERKKNVELIINGTTYYTSVVDRNTAKWFIDDIRKNGYLYETDKLIEWFGPGQIESISIKI